MSLNFDIFCHLVPYLSQDVLVTCLRVCKNSKPIVQKLLLEKVLVLVVPIKNLQHVENIKKYLIKLPKKVPAIIVLREQFMNHFITSFLLSRFVESVSHKVTIVDIVEVPFQKGKQGVFIIPSNSKQKGLFAKVQETNDIISTRTDRPFMGWNIYVNAKWEGRYINTRLQPIIPTQRKYIISGP